MLAVLNATQVNREWFGPVVVTILVSRTGWNGDRRNMRRVDFRRLRTLLVYDYPVPITRRVRILIVSWKRKNDFLNRHGPDVRSWEVSTDR